jgi:catechol 2,3-dioxygenase-like lactoylglutathione lyase family enzyme
MQAERILTYLIITAGLLLSTISWTQLAMPNRSGVAMGHLHYFVDDPESEKSFWLQLGGSDMGLEGRAGVSFPGLIILIAEGEAEGGSEGSVVNHVAFRVDSLEEMEQKGFDLEYNQEFPGIASVYSPSGERVELFDDQLATNIGFDLDPGQLDVIAERHNQPLTAEIVTHHLHFYLPAGQAETARDWYVEHFGATPGQRWRYRAADLPGMNLNFSEVDVAQAPTAGRTLNHIGFEVVGLEEFCKQLEASGVQFDTPYRTLESGLGLAFFTDPWGTRIELTEGLSELGQR